MSYDGKESLPALSPERLISLLTRVRTMFVDAGISTEIRIGESFIDQEGNGNRVVFVPRPAVGSTVEQPIRIGAFGAVRNDMGCTTYIWGIGTNPDDVYATAEQILHNVQVALCECGGDRVSFKAYDRDEEPRDVHYGEQYRFSFSYLYQVDRNTALRPFPDGTTAVAAPTIQPKSLEE